MSSVCYNGINNLSVRKADLEAVEMKLVEQSDCRTDLDYSGGHQSEGHVCDCADGVKLRAIVAGTKERR